MKKILLIITLGLFFNTNSYAASFNCHYKFKDKNGIYKTDVFATSYIEINTWLKKMTFFPIKMEHMKRNEGIKFDTLNISKSKYSKKTYFSEKFKQRKLTEKGRKRFKDNREYLWEEVKDEYLTISISNIGYNPFNLQIAPFDLQKKWQKNYVCYKPRN
ncbi:hypothetical protein [Candidatus Pelagibacter sp.]|uniref:hypothetical protein n=1 Tax=Candidatus Pelagibacter sp. TaxID=2024849 RepID=UPI003F850323